MKKVIYRFEFDEENFGKSKKEFEDFLKQAEYSGASISFLKEFPPCILEGKSCHPVGFSQSITLSNQRLLADCNIFFGKDYLKINKIFLTSPFISQMCRDCSHNRSGECRGMPNRKFLAVRHALEKKMGKDAYNAARSDYENGMFAAGSSCKSKCKFCLDSRLPESLIRKIPFLTASEVMHFLHYIPKRVSYIGSSFHCKSGEITDSPYFREIMDALKHFASRKLIILTNGRSLDEGKIQKFKSLGAELGVSIITLDPMRRAELMGDGSCEDYLQKLKLLAKSRLKHHVCIVPMRQLVESEDIFSTIDRVLESSPECSIRVNPPSSHKWMDKGIASDLNLDYESLKKILKQKYKEKVWFIDEMNKGESSAKIKETLSKFRSACLGRRGIVLCPAKTYDEFKALDSENIRVKKVWSCAGFTNPCAGSLTVEDYANQLKAAETGFDIIFVPRNSFDRNIEDLRLESLNKLWEHAKEKAGEIMLL